MKVAIYREEHFNAAHRLHNPTWTDQRNVEVFDKCNSPNYHGHNYELHVKLIGEIDPETGYVYDIKKLSLLIKEEIIDRLDHKNLNLDVEEFSNLNPTAENIVIVIHDLLRKKIEDKYELRLRLYETKRNYVEYPV